MLERWKESEKAYLRALTLEPNQKNAKKNLGVLYQKASSIGRLSRLAAPKPGAPAGQAFTGYEISTPLER